MTGSGADWEQILLDCWRTAQQRSVVGPGDPRVHLERARAMAEVLDEPELALDLGSGAGIPGLALAGIWPDSAWILLDGAQRRVNLLMASVTALGWSDRVQVRHGRAEQLGHEPSLRGRVDLVTARSFGPPASTAECGAPFLAEGGILAVTEPPDSTGERWPADGVARLGLAVEGLRDGVQLLRRRGPLASTYPRRVGLPDKRPLF